MAASSFPEFITSRRRELDLTLGDVATNLGVSPVTVSTWSNGQSTPKPENLVALANLLQVPADDLAEMAGVDIKLTFGATVNLMPPPAAEPEPEAAAEPEPEAAAEPEPEAAAEPEPEAVSDDAILPVEEAEEVAEIPVPIPELDPPTGEELPTPDDIDSELAEMIEDAAPEVEEEAAPDIVPASVTGPAPASKPTAPPKRRPTVLRRPRTTAPERPVTTLPLTYIEDPKQLLRYRIRWALTAVVLVIMFMILLWASRELISALSEVKESVTPGGIGGGG